MSFLSMLLWDDLTSLTLVLAEALTSDCLAGWGWPLKKVSITIGNNLVASSTTVLINSFDCRLTRAGPWGMANKDYAMILMTNHVELLTAFYLIYGFRLFDPSSKYFTWRRKEENQQRDQKLLPPSPGKVFRNLFCQNL